MLTFARSLPLGAILACNPGGPRGPVLLTDDNNFTYTATLDLEVFELQSEADVLVDWSALTRDMRGGALDPVTQVDEAWALVFQGMEPDALTVEIAQDTIAQDDVTLYVACEPTDASCRLSDMSFLGNDLGGVPAYFTEGRGSWLLALYADDASVVQSMAILLASDDSTITEARLTDDSAVLTAEVDLTGLEPVALPEGADITLDWSAIGRDGLGNPISTYTLDHALLGRYAEPLDELEGRFFELEDLAEASWELDVDGTDTALLSDLDGFDGVTADGTWLLALLCSSCDNPAPRFLTRLVPEDP